MCVCVCVCVCVHAGPDTCTRTHVCKCMHVCLVSIFMFVCKVSIIVSLLIGIVFCGMHRFCAGASFGYHALFKPTNHSLVGQTFDVLVGAGGRHVGIRGFPRKEMGQSLSLAITANFVNK